MSSLGLEDVSPSNQQKILASSSKEIQSEADLLNQFNSLCDNDKKDGSGGSVGLAAGTNSGNGNGTEEEPSQSPKNGQVVGGDNAEGTEDDMFNVSNIMISNRNNESEFNMNDNLELNQIMAQFTKTDLRLMEEILDKLRDIIKEDDQILEYFMVKVPQCKSIQEVVQLLEALYFEQKVRIDDKKKNIGKLQTCLDKQASNFKNAESVIKRSRSLSNTQ